MWLNKRLVLVDHKRPDMYKADKKLLKRVALKNSIDPELVSSVTIARLFSEADSEGIFKAAKENVTTAREMAEKITPEAIGYSFCSKKDNFHRQKGFLTSVNRALKATSLVLKARQDEKGHKKYDLVKEDGTVVQTLPE